MNETYDINSYYENVNTQIYTKVDKEVEDDKKNNLRGSSIYYSDEWNLVTFFVDGMVVKISPLKNTELVQSPSQNEISDILPEGATFLGWGYQW